MMNEVALILILSGSGQLQIINFSWFMINQNNMKSLVTAFIIGLNVLAGHLGVRGLAPEKFSGFYVNFRHGEHL